MGGAPGMLLLKGGNTGKRRTSPPWLVGGWGEEGKPSSSKADSSSGAFGAGSHSGEERATQCLRPHTFQNNLVKSA